MKKAYFARCIADYGKDFDQHCIKEIESLGFEVVDPNEFFDQEKYDAEGMEFFFSKIEECDVFFFKALRSGSITAGVFKEAAHAYAQGIPVYEIPFYINQRVMTKEATREYLKAKGVR